jgi:hypothetical protein
MSNLWLNPGLDARLRELHADKWRSFSNIADALNTEFGISLTHHACIGRAFRLKLPRRPPVPPPTLPQRDSSGKFLPGVGLKRSHHRRSAPLPPKSFNPTLPIEPDRLVSLLDAGPEHCRYPFGEKPVMFCGREPLEGCDYCTEHWRLMHERGRP